jgi:hypothetical protein
MCLVVVALDLLYDKSEDPNLTLLAALYSDDIRTADWSYEQFLRSEGMLLRLVSHALTMLPLDQARDGDICEDIKEDLAKLLDI